MISWARKNIVAIGFISPALVLVAILLVVPVAQMFTNSLHQYDPFKGSLPGLTLEHYKRFFSDPFFAGILVRTIWISAATTLLCFVIGYPIAYFFVFHARLLRTPILIGLLSPLFVSALVRTYGWLILLGQGGSIDKLSQAIGLTARSTTILKTEAAIIIGMAHLFLAFMVLSIITALQNIDPALMRAAQIGGATPWRAFRRVVWPLSIPGALTGAVLVFSLSAGAFITPAMLGGMRVRVMSIAIWEQVSVLHNYSFGSVLAVLLLVIVVTFVFLGTMFTNSRYR
jgi:putative spermidine/putrescine transport system permease protein